MVKIDDPEEVAVNNGQMDPRLELLRKAMSRRALAGKVVVLSEMRDTVGLIMLSQGVDISQPFTNDQFMAALDVLQQQVDSGQVSQVKGNSYKEDLINGQAFAAIAWSGDIFPDQCRRRRVRGRTNAGGANCSVGGQNGVEAMFSWVSEVEAASGYDVVLTP
jgi:hypothetical protein